MTRLAYDRGCRTEQVILACCDFSCRPPAGIEFAAWQHDARRIGLGGPSGRRSARRQLAECAGMFNRIPARSFCSSKTEQAGCRGSRSPDLAGIGITRVRTPKIMIVLPGGRSGSPGPVDTGVVGGGRQSRPRWDRVHRATTTLAYSSASSGNRPAGPGGWADGPGRSGPGRPAGRTGRLPHVGGAADRCGGHLPGAAGPRR